MMANAPTGCGEHGGSYQLVARRWGTAVAAADGEAVSARISGVAGALHAPGWCQTSPAGTARLGGARPSVNDHRGVSERRRVELITEATILVALGHGRRRVSGRKEQQGVRGSGSRFDVGVGFEFG